MRATKNDAGLPTHLNPAPSREESEVGSTVDPDDPWVGPYRVQLPETD